MTRTELLTALAYRLNKTPPPSMDATVQARLISFLNQRQRRLLTLPGVRHLREATVTFASVADQPDYVLANISKIKRMWEITDDRTLYEMSQQDYRILQPNTTITGTPEAYVWTGRQEVAKQPADASSLFVKSTSASDTTQTVYLEGVITGNYPVSASVTLTGTVAVDIDTTIALWIRVDKFFLSAACVGKITLHEDSGAGTELARISIGRTRQDYSGFSLYMTPSGAITYYVDVDRAVTDFSQATDVPILPEDFHDVIMLGALADELGHTKDARQAEVMYELEGPPSMKGRGGRVGEMLYWLAETAIGQPFSLTRGWQKPSQLGNWYPAGS